MQSTIRFLKSKTCHAALLSVGLIVALSSCSKKSSDGDPDPNPPATVEYKATFVKSASNVTTSATGTVTGNFNTSTRELSYTVNWNGLTSEVVDMHFHDAGPVIIHISGFPTAVTGQHVAKATFTADQASDLAKGQVYVQIHTANYPGGEIIGVLTKKSGTVNPGDPPPYTPPY